MTLDRLRPLIGGVLQPFVRAAMSVGLSANGISILGLLAAIGAAIALYLGGSTPIWYLIGAALVFANGWLDLIDGALARRRGTQSPSGDLLDHVFDRYADIVIVAGLAAGAGEIALGFAAVTGVLMTSYLGTQAIAVGLDRVYGGLVGRADRLALIGIVAVLATIWPDTIGGMTLIAWLLLFLAVIGHLTAVQRFVLAMRALD